jgi:hypothetical protein
VGRAQQGGGPGGRESAVGAARLQLSQQHAQPAQGPGALGVQVVATVAEQPEDIGVVLEGDWA